METLDHLGRVLPTQKNKFNFTYFYYLEYYPTRFQVEEKYQMRRKKIWDFKDGVNSGQIAKMLKSDINYLNLTPPLSNWWLCVIPASTKEKTEERFHEFCAEFTSGNQINNGFNLISLKEDRQAKHLTDDRNSVGILSTLEFTGIRGKSILLFDDIYTTGKSFLAVARKLISLGASEVVGLFLGKTHWIEENTEIF